jgi:uncharacterized protein (TIRG00374 family)
LANGSSSAVGGELLNSAGLYAAGGAMALAVMAVAAWWSLKTPDRRARLLGSLKQILLSPRERPAEALVSLVTTTVYWVLQGAVLWLLVDAFGADPSPTFILGLTSVPILIGMLSPIPGGAVVREALMYAVARLADVDGDPVIAAALVYRFALFAAIPILYLLTRWWIARHSTSGAQGSVT